MKKISSEEKKELYIKAHNLIKYAKLHKYQVEKDIISEEGLTFLGNFTGRNNLLYERIRNVKLRIELAHSEKIIEKNEYKIEDTLADMNACAINEFSGNMPSDMKELYDYIKDNYCDERITDDYIHELSCEKASKNESYLPIVHEEKKKGIFAAIKAQIAFYRIENKKLEDLIVKERGKMQFETFSSDNYTVIVPAKKSLEGVNT